MKKFDRISDEYIKHTGIGKIPRDIFDRMEKNRFNFDELVHIFWMLYLNVSYKFLDQILYIQYVLIRMIFANWSYCEINQLIQEVGKNLKANELRSLKHELYTAALTCANLQYAKSLLDKDNITRVECDQILFDIFLEDEEYQIVDFMYQRSHRHQKTNWIKYYGFYGIVKHPDGTMKIIFDDDFKKK